MRLLLQTDVYGSSTFGSGYPYGGYGIYVDNRPCPYYFYPVPPANNHYGGDEVSPHLSILCFIDYGEISTLTLAMPIAREAHSLKLSCSQTGTRAQ